MPKTSNLLPDPGAENPRSPTFENQLIELESVDSTNNYAMARIHEGLANNGLAYLAHHQTAGKGQRGKTWLSEPRQNLSMSLVIQPAPLELTQQFLFSAAIVLGILDTVRAIEPQNWTVKWPNDIYWNDRKAAGILIESVIQGKDWRYAVVGVGMNVNTQSFPPEIPNSVSLKQITGKHFDPVTIARQLIPSIQHQIIRLKRTPQEILYDFNRFLFKNEQMQRFKKGQEVFDTRVLGVNEAGLLLTSKASFMTGEVEWILGQ